MSERPVAVSAVFLPYFKRYKLAMAIAFVALCMGAAASLILGRGLQWLIDNGFAAADQSALMQAIILLGGIVLLMTIATFTRFYAVTWLGERVAADIREAVFAKLLSLDPQYFESHKSGDMMAQLTTDTTLLQSIIGSSLSFALRSGITALGAVAMMLYTNPMLSSVVIVGVPLVLLPILALGRRMRRLSRASQDRVAEVGSYAGEIIRQIKTVKAFSREGFENNAFSEEVNRAFAVAKQRILNRSILVATVMILAFAIIATMIYLGGQAVINGEMSAGELTAFLFYAVMLAMSTAGVSEVMGELQRAAGAAERLAEVLQEQALIIDGPAPLERVNSAPYLQIKDLEFSYPSRAGFGLSDINLSIQRGQTVAVVGPSGAGKSTLFELLLRFYVPTRGQICLAGQDISTLALADLRQHFAWVPQQAALFSGDVRRNIMYGNPDATEASIINAAADANALEFIEDLAEGFNSELGEAGILLSGGQKQRLAIARALLADPQILLLDEATSALDARSEHKVQQGLNRLMQGRTTIVIAHRLSTVINADQILVMDQGKIVASGTHQQLLQSNDLYQDLARLQLQAGDDKSSF